MWVEYLTLVGAVAGAYALGGIPTAVIVGRQRGVDIRLAGSRNVGAANAAEAFGWKPGAVVLTADAAKGAVAIALAVTLGLEGWALAWVALAVVAGHNFSPYIGFGGGRGVAAALGVSSVVVPPIAGVGLAVGAAWFWRTRSVVGAGYTAFILTNVLVVALRAPGAVLGMCGLVSTLVLATHLWRERARRNRVVEEAR